MSARPPARSTLRVALLLGALGWACLAFAAGTDAAGGTVPKPPAGTEAPPAADPHDLGRGLRFVQFAAATPAQADIERARTSAALVIDLRLADDSPANAERLPQLCAEPGDRPVFLLVGEQTPPALLRALPPRPRLLMLAAEKSGLPAGLSVSVDPLQDLRAAEAIAAGRPPAELFAPRIEKARFDEARLTENHANGFHELARPRADLRSADAEVGGTDTEKDPPLEDVLLQRAVFLHRALLALGRIPDHT